MALIIIGMLLSYLIGSIPTAYIFVKVIAGIDIRKYGSGNVGATNAARVLGKWPAFFVLVLDIFKGIFVVTILAGVFIARVDIAPELIKAAFGFCVVCGHVFNIFMQFKGGKGVATSAGVFIGVAPLAALVGAGCFLITVFFTRYVSLGSVIASVIIPFYMLVAKYPNSYIILSAFVCIIVVAKHKANIKRLLTGTERKVFKK